MLISEYIYENFDVQAITNIDNYFPVLIKYLYVAIGSCSWSKHCKKVQRPRAGELNAGE